MQKLHSRSVFLNQARPYWSWLLKGHRCYKLNEGISSSHVWAIIESMTSRASINRWIRELSNVDASDSGERADLTIVNAVWGHARGHAKGHISLDLSCLWPRRVNRSFPISPTWQIFNLTSRQLVNLAGTRSLRSSRQNESWLKFLKSVQWLLTTSALNRIKTTCTNTYLNTFLFWYWW